jgi:cellulose biosynthesis protein BcsQ
MERLLRTGFSCALLIVAAATQSPACGDKVLALGRAIKLAYVSTHSASILLYLRSGLPSAPVISDASLQSALKKSSQVLRIVNDADELKQALNRGKYDLIITDPQDAPGIEQQLQAISAHTVVVPMLYQSTKAEASALIKRYHVVLKAPSKTDNYLLAIDEAMEMKTKRDEIKVVAKK